MSPATLRAARAKSHSFRSRLRLTYLEDGITPTDYPNFASLSHSADNPSLASFEPFTPPTSSSVTPSSAAIAEWTRTGGPDHTLAITGDSLTRYDGVEAGKDTEFMVFGKQQPTPTAGQLLRLDGSRAAVTLPTSVMDQSMYLVWPRNADGFGRPVAVQGRTHLGPRCGVARR